MSSRNLKESAKVSCHELVRYTPIAAIRSRDGFYANCVVLSQTCVALAFN